MDLQNDESVAVALGQVLNIPRKTLVVVGGANGLSNKDRHRLETLFTEVICPFAETHSLVVVDGRHRLWGDAADGGNLG